MAYIFIYMTVFVKFLSSRLFVSWRSGWHDRTSVRRVGDWYYWI